MYWLILKLRVQPRLTNSFLSHSLKKSFSSTEVEGEGGQGVEEEEEEDQILLDSVL